MRRGLRIAASVVVGYVAMAALVVAGTGLAWLILGAEAAFRASSQVASAPWSALMCLFGFAAAAVGGCLAAAVGRQDTRTPEQVLAGLVLVLGFALAFMQLGAEPPALPEGRTTAQLTWSEAGRVAVSPTWYNFSIPCIGAAGVLLGPVLGARWRRNPST